MLSHVIIGPPGLGLFSQRLQVDKHTQIPVWTDQEPKKSRSQNKRKLQLQHTAIARWLLQWPLNNEDCEQQKVKASVQIHKLDFDCSLHYSPYILCILGFSLQSFIPISSTWFLSKPQKNYQNAHRGDALPERLLEMLQLGPPDETHDWSVDKHVKKSHFKDQPLNISNLRGNWSVFSWWRRHPRCGDAFLRLSGTRVQECAQSW